MALVVVVCIGPGDQPANAQGNAPVPAPLPAPIAAKLKVLDAFVGSWNMTVTTRVPKPSVVTYTETDAWTLDGRYLRGETGRKSDGTQDVSMATFDQPSGGYVVWIFSSSGESITLGLGQWNEATRTITWKNPAGSTLAYETRCSFKSADARQCTSWLKDWKGTLLLERDISATRRP